MAAGDGLAAGDGAASENVNGPYAKYAAEGRRIAADPAAYLRQMQKKVNAMDAYRLVFYRQERAGLPPRLGPLEKIVASFRREPFSVRFEWPDEDMPYYESVYVQGQNDNKLVIRERKGVFLFVPPQVRVIDVMFPVKIGKAKNPITDFGLARIVERTLLPFDDPDIRAVMTVAYQGVTPLDSTGAAAHHLRIERPQIKSMIYTRQDFYIDAQTLLPAGTDLYLPGDTLDVRYRYTEIRTDVHWTDADFRLSKDHPASADSPQP